MAAGEKCVLYLRSSKDRADISPAAQRTELKDYAREKDLRPVAEYVDAAISANDNPPQLAILLRELKNPKREWTVILAVDSSRLARDADLAGVIAYECRKVGVRIEYSKMPASGNAGMDMIVEPLNSCSSIFSAEGNPVTAGLSLRCSGFGVALAVLPLSVALCRLMASKTLPIVSPRSWNRSYRADGPI